MSEKDSLKQDRVLPVICIDAPSDKSSETKALKDITSAPIDLEELSAVTDVEGRLQQVEHVLLKLQQPLQCSICLDLLSNPLSTKCGHNFCTLCIHRLLQGVRGPSSCPLCLAPVTKRSLEKKDRISQLVLAVRGIIEGIKKDCGLINSPSKSRALALPAVEDNSDEEEMDEPRRGTRKRVAVPEYSEVGPLLEDGIDSGAGHRGVKKGRNKRGTALIPARNVSAPDVLSLDKTSGIDGRRSSKPVSLKDSSHAMRRSAVDLAVSNPDQLKTLEASSKPTTGAPGPVGGRGRGRGRGGRGRGRTSNAGSTKSLGPSTMSSDEELVSVSQVKETKLALRSADDVNNIQSNQNEIKEVNFLKPKDKVSLWLNESSAIGFKIGLSQAPNSKPPSVMPKTISANVSESQAKLVFKDTPVPKDKAIDVVIPSGDDDENVFALPVFRKCDKEANGKFSDKSGEKLETSSARASSIVYPLDNISKSTAEINKASAFIEDLEEDELPDINCTSKFDEFAESTPRDSNKGRVLEECSLDVSAISANSLIDPKAEELDVLPDSCPVNTKDLFDVLVETARKIPPSSPLEVDTRKDKTTADDVYFFCTPAEGNDVDVASEKANAAKVKVNKKRTLECAREQNDPTKRSKVPVQSLVGKSSSLENISASPAGKKEDLKALKSVTATANKNSKLKMSSASTVGKEKLKSLKSSAASVNLLASVSNGDGETAALVPSCEAMPPPAVPESFAQSFDRKARGTRTGGRGAAVASKSAKTRYASELKKQFCEPPKLVATSLCVKDFKSPGWSHVAGAKKDLKSRHIGLNITGGDIKQDLSRLDRTTEPDKTVGDDPMKRSTGNDLRLVSSSESSVEIDDQTQMVDVRNFDRAPEDLDKISKQKIKVHPMNGENIIESSDSDGKKLLEVTSAKGAPEGAKVQQNEADVQKKKETPLYTTVVPETQSDSAKSVCGSEKLLSADAGACLGNPLPESPLATGSSSKVPFVRLSAHRKPVESKVAAKKSKTKLIPYSSSETSGIHTAIPEVQLTSESSSLETNEIVVSQMAPPASNCIEQEKNNDGFNGKSNVCITETNKVISDGSSDRALKISSSDVSSEDHRGNGPPVRRVMRSGRRRRDIPSSVSSSSVLENISKVRTKPPKTKPNLGSGEEKENVDVEGLPRSPRSLKDMQRRSKSSADLSGNATSYSTVAERAKLRSSLRSANLHVEPVLPAVPKKSTQANGVTVEDSDVAVVDAMVGEVLQENVEESGVELQNLKSSVNDVRDLKTFSRDVEKEGFVDGNPTRVVSSCMLEPGTQVSYTTAYCLTEATKFSSLETSSTSLPSDLPAQSVEIKVGPKNSTTNQVDAANDPIAIPCSGENITKSFRKKFSSEDSQGLEFEERTIIPTVFKNKRMQVDLRTQRRDAATQTSNSGVELASVAVQCELLAERVKHFNVQTEVLGKEVAVQVQLAPESSHVAGVIPFGAVGDSCSDRCIGPLEVLRKTARAQKQCLHAVPCALYQTLLSMLHLVPAQPLTCCGHKAPISETSMADGSSNVEKNSDFKIAPNVLSDPSTGVDKESNCLESSNLLNARNDESSTSENAPIRTAFCSQGIASSKADPVADVDLTSAVEKIATRRQARKKLGLANTIHEEKPLKAQNSKVKKLISLLERNGSAESNFERNAMPTTSQDLKTDDAATDLNLPVCNNETRSSAGNTLSDTLLLDAKQEAKNQQTFKEHLMLNMNHSQTQMSLEIPFLGGVNIQPQVLLKDCTSPARQLSLQQKCLSVISPQHPHNKNDNLVIPSDDSDSFKSTITSRVTRQRSKIAEKPSSQSDIFASYVAQSRAQDAVSDEESSVVSGPSMSKLTAKKRKVMDEAKSSGKLSSSDRKMVSPESDNIGKAKKKNKLKSPQSALGIKPKISESNLCKNIENRKFKRIRSVDDSDSSCDDEPPGKKPALGKNKLTTVVFGVSGHNEASDNMDTYEKNSEELRLEKYDDGVLKYFGYPNGRSSTSTVSPGVELLDKGDETTEDISHLSILSTQSEVISTQHRNKVQNEVEMLQAKWVALKERLSTLKHGPSHAEEGITLIADGKHAQERSDKSHEVASEKPIRIPGDDLDENKDSGDENVFDHDGIAANIKKSTPHLTAGEINVGAKTNIVKPSSLRSTTQPCASELTSASGLSLIRTTRATVSKLAGQADRKVEVSRACNKAETITSHVPSTNARREADDQDLFSSLPDLNSDFVPDSEEAAKKISTCSVIKRNESKSGSTLESVEKRSVLVCTGLSGVEMVSVYKLVKALYRSPDACPDADTPVGELLKSWAPSVTHVIVKCGEDRTTERTLKYLFGVASGCWVIGFEWARRCLQEGRLLNESNFEALDSTGYPGPERGRRLRGQLFRGCVFYCAPPFRDVSRQQLHELVQLCGGQVVEDAALLKTHKAPVSAGEASTKRHQLQLIIVHTEEEEDQSKNLAKDLSERYDRAVVASDWLIECVAMYSLVALSPYLLSPPHEHILKASGISLEILQETQELV
ncbi:BRCT domain [Trinorchestia longiramus]|nr:BRCT domain [Trinorchestia longiramus]